MQHLDFSATLTSAEARRLRRQRGSPKILIGGLMVAGLVWMVSGVSLSPTNAKFDPLPLGSGTEIKKIVLTNHNLTDFVPTGIVLTGAASRDFNVDPRPCARIDAGDECTLLVEFRPQQEGERLAQLVVYDSNGEQITAQLSGSAKGTPPPRNGAIVRFEPLQFDFSTPNDPRQVLTVRNTGDAPLLLQSSLAGQDSDSFAIDQGSCGSVQPHSQCTILVSWNPTFAGDNKPRNAQLQISHNAANSPSRVQVPLIWNPALTPEMQFAPAIIDFSRPNQPHQSLTIANVGEGPLELRFNLAGQNPDRFSLDQSNCGLIPPHGRCVLAVSYKTKFFGGNKPLSAQIEISHNAPNMPTPQEVALSWKLVPLEHARLTMEPESTGPMTGQTDMKITVQNVGTVAVKKLNFRLGLFGGGENKQFSYVPDCPTAFAPGAKCTVVVKYHSDKPGNYDGILYAFDGALDSLVSVNLAGQTAPRLMYTKPLQTQTGGSGQIQ